MVDIFKLMPHATAIRQRIADFESCIQQEFGQNIVVSIALIETKYQIDAIAKLVSETLNFTMTDLLTGRKGDVVLARHLAIYLCKEHIHKAKLKEIAYCFNSVHHTTVMNSCNVVKDLLETKNEAMTAYYTKCQQAINKIINDENDLHKGK